MKHYDLWNDSLDEAIPCDLAAASLKAMQRTARGAAQRRKERRRIAGAALLGVVCASGALALWPGTHMQQPRPTTGAIAAKGPASTVRYLSDDEFVEHLNTAGYGIAVMQNGGHKRALLLPRVMAIAPGGR